MKLGTLCEMAEQLGYDARLVPGDDDYDDIVID